jgi:hypothetical protein
MGLAIAIFFILKNILIILLRNSLRVHYLQKEGGDGISPGAIRDIRMRVVTWFLQGMG